MTRTEATPADLGFAPPEHVETVVIGGGQAGLATSYHLARRGRPHVVLEGSERVGDVWRQRFDSLRLFSPARYDGLPGMPFPLPGWEFPTGREMADYLESYAATFALPVRTGISVDGLSKHGEHYVVTSGHRRFEAANVVVASGTWQSPMVPGFADELDPGIRQMHSAEYRNPSQLQPGPVLLVGCSHSGPDLAVELAPTHPVHLSGPIEGEIPFRIDSRMAHLMLPVLWFVANHVLTMRTPLGRKVAGHVRSGGGPLIRVQRSDIEAAGVDYTPERTVGVRDGRPVLGDGRVLDVANVVWCTGFGKDTDWIQVPIGEDRWPTQSRGVVPDAPGLYFVGLPFLQGFYSMLIGGVGRDAGFVARHIDRRTGSAPATTGPAPVAAA
jgi:putative flavoprotein involved in K+ transport